MLEQGVWTKWSNVIPSSKLSIKWFCDFIHHCLQVLLGRAVGNPFVSQPLLILVVFLIWGRTFYSASLNPMMFTWLSHGLTPWTCPDSSGWHAILQACQPFHSSWCRLQIPLMKTLNSIGLHTDSRGKSLIIDIHTDVESLTTTVWIWQSNQFLIHQICISSVWRAWCCGGHPRPCRSPDKWHLYLFPYSLMTTLCNNNSNKGKNQTKNLKKQLLRYSDQLPWKGFSFRVKGCICQDIWGLQRVESHVQLKKKIWLCFWKNCLKETLFGRSSHLGDFSHGSIVSYKCMLTHKLYTEMETVTAAWAESRSKTVGWETF